MGDRGWRPRPETPEPARELEGLEGVEGPDLRRQALEWNWRSTRPQEATSLKDFQSKAGKRRRKRRSSLCVRPDSLRTVSASRGDRSKKGRGTKGMWRRSQDQGPVRSRHSEAVSFGRMRSKTGEDSRSEARTRKEEREATAQPAGRPTSREEGTSAGERAPEEGARLFCEATPELVRQDRGKRSPKDRNPGNTGRSNARRSGGWQRCRPPFRVVGPQASARIRQSALS